MSLIDDSREEAPFTEDEFAVNLEYGAYREEIAPVPVHQCNVCNKIFMSFKGLQQHAVIHTDTKPFQCDVCGRGFRFKSNMFEHRTVHTGYTPHLCPFCGKQFRLKGNMKKHMRVHVTNKEELEAAYRPFSSNRKASSIVPENALVIRGSPLPYYGREKRRGVPKLQLGNDPSRWVNMICHNELLPTAPFSDKMMRANMRLMGDQSFSTMFENCKALEFEIYWCPFCKCDCSGREECETHLYSVHGKKPEDMDREPNYCSKCMRTFSNEGMFLQHQSYHSRVQLMMRNQEIDCISPEIGLPEICYNMLSSQVPESLSSEDMPKVSNFSGESSSSKPVYQQIETKLNNPGDISLGINNNFVNNNVKNNVSDYMKQVIKHEIDVDSEQNMLCSI